MKKSLSLKIIGVIPLVAFIVLPIYVYIDLKNLNNIYEISYMQKAKTIAAMLDGSIRSRSDLNNRARLFLIIQKSMWLEPDILCIDVNLPHESGLSTYVSSEIDRVGSSADNDNMKAYRQNLVVSKAITMTDDQRILKVVTPIHVAKQEVGTYQIELTLEEADRQLKAAINAAILRYIATLGIFVVILGWFMQKILVKPLKVINAGIEAMAADNLDQAVKVRSQDELGQLADAFNRMAGELQNAIAEVQKHSRNLELEITKKEAAEKGLRESEGRYRSILESMKDAAYIASAEFSIDFINARMSEMVGDHAANDLCYQVIFGRDHKCPWCVMGQVQRGKHMEYEHVGPRDIGRHYTISNSPLRHAEGKISMLAIFRDITELKKIESQLSQSQKMEAIGTMAGGIAHDFNNMLAPLLGFAELLKGKAPADSPMQNYINEILSAAMRARDLVKQILTFSRQAEHEIKPVELQAIVAEVQTLLRASIPSTIRIVQDIDPNCGVVLADATKVHQIIINLATNAFHSMEKTGGQLRLALQQVCLKPVPPSLSGLIPGEYALLTVADDGSGIEPQVLERIFDPYFTTKDAGKGTGLGLSVVQGIVKSFNGDI